MPAKCGDTTPKQEEALSEVINTGKARNTSTLLENAHSSEVLYFKRVAERSLNYSRHDLFMCHVLGSRTRRDASTPSMDITLENFPISSHRLAVHTQFESTHGLPKFSSMNLLTSPSHVSSIPSSSHCYQPGFSSPLGHHLRSHVSPVLGTESLHLFSNAHYLLLQSARTQEITIPLCYHSPKDVFKESKTNLTNTIFHMQD